MKTGIIGLGAMGYPMAVNLHRAGLLVASWNRTVAKAEMLQRETGVEPAASPADLAHKADVVVINVSADADVMEMVEAILPGLTPGQIVIDASTVSRETAVQAAWRLSEAGVAFIDGPVTGGVEGAEKGTLTMMAGGDAVTLEEARPVLDAVTARVVHMGENGMGQAAKAVNQVMMAGVNQAVSEALAFGAALGLPSEELVSAVESGAAGGWFAQNRGRSMLAGEFPTGFQTALHQKDLEICRAMAAELGAELPIVEATLADYEALLERGFGSVDISSLHTLKSKPFDDS